MSKEQLLQEFVDAFEQVIAVAEKRSIEHCHEHMEALVDND